METQGILRILERRIEKSKYSGFSNQTLLKRKEMLVESSKTLIDPEKRKGYENKIMNTSLESNVEKIEVKPGNQIAGLLLLLEAGHAEECLTLAYIEYHKWKSRIGDLESCYQDLLRVIDYATLEYAKKLKENRFYENSAAVIERRLTYEALDISTKEMKTQMERDLKKLKPYRILDLVSRETGETSHENGINMLKNLVNERGGLESESEQYMKDVEFKAFFRQVRLYLTVQEQIDIFKDWALSGSKVSTFLAVMALVASGFVQRKPEKMVEALQVLKKIRTAELEPIVANIYLLLGDVKAAEDLFEMYADTDLKEWSQNWSDETLGKMCGWCREWLSRDVLCGYRDIDSEANLESYFSDRDVIKYLESIDKQNACSSFRNDQVYGTEILAEPVGNRVKRDTFDENRVNINKKKVKHKDFHWINFSSRLHKMGKKKVLVALIALTIGTGIINSFRPIELNQSTVVTSLQDGKESVKESRIGRKKGRDEFSDMSTIYNVIAKYHSIKRNVLAGGGLPSDARNYLSDDAIGRILSEQNKNSKRGEVQFIDVNIRELTIKERTESKISLKTVLYYKDKILNDKGRIISVTSGHTFERMYTLINKGNRWVVN